MRQLLLALVLALCGSLAQAQITAQECQDAVDAWLEAGDPDRAEEILDDSEACIAANGAGACWTAWSASVQPNTDPGDSAIATVTNNDPGPYVVCEVCSDYADWRNSFATTDCDDEMTATGPAWVRLENLKMSAEETYPRLVVQFKHDNVIYERRIGRGSAPSVPWHSLP